MRVTIQEKDRQYKIYRYPQSDKPALPYRYDTYEYAEFACKQRGWEIVEPKETPKLRKD